MLVIATLFDFNQLSKANFFTNKLLYLKNDSLSEKIINIMEMVNFVNGSIQTMRVLTNHTNAYFSGFGSGKEIVFFDSLIDQFSDDEILGIFCHELGHWYYNHILVFVSAVLISEFIYLFILKSNIKINEKLCYDCNYIRISLLLVAVDTSVDLVKNYIFRVLELQADTLAVKLGCGKQLIAGLKKLSETNLEFPVANPLYSALFATHPQSFKRIAAIEEKLNSS